MTAGLEAGPWPDLPLAGWRGTRDALHLMTQVVGKTLLAGCAPLNHWWHCALRVTARGLAGAAPMVFGGAAIDVELDLVDHVLTVRGGRGAGAMPLGPGTLHQFHDRYLDLLHRAGADVHVWTTPAELPGGTPFDRDDAPRPYDRAAAHTFWQVLRRCDAVLRDLASAYVGKQSPVHFFWGSFDLAATRFSGRRAPLPAGADRITREAYSHEVLSFGFWPGGLTAGGIEVGEPILYAYAAPEPPRFREAPLPPGAGRYDATLGEFVLPYAALRAAARPAAEARAFFEAVYADGAARGGWPRAALERAPAVAGGAESATSGPPPSEEGTCATT